jgi:AraC-like DNA-binding protein
MRISLEQWEALAESADYDCRKLAASRGHSLRQLEREFHAVFGPPPHVWLNEQRVEAAERLLLSGKPVKWVAFELGYKQPSHFCRQFKLNNHVTPSQFASRAHGVADTSCEPTQKEADAVPKRGVFLEPCAFVTSAPAP